MEDNFNKHLGNKLKLRRLALGLTQPKVAKAINVTFQQIQKYEKGANGMSATRFLQVCIFFKITPTEFAIQAGVMIQDKITSAVPMAQLTNHAIAVNKDEKEEEKKD